MQLPCCSKFDGLLKTGLTFCLTAKTAYWGTACLKTRRMTPHLTLRDLLLNEKTLIRLLRTMVANVAGMEAGDEEAAAKNSLNFNVMCTQGQAKRLPISELPVSVG